MMKSILKLKTKITAIVLCLLMTVSFAGCSTGKKTAVDLTDDYRVYYEIFVRSFYDSDGDGIGDLNGVREKLSYLQELGVTGIWLMPVTQGNSYHKYDVVDYRSVDTEYGSLEDFKKLAEACHKANMRLVIDFVINHTSSENEWFQEACSYLQELPEGAEPSAEACPYFGYYHFSKEQQANWYQVTGTDWYYEAEFSYDMPDLDLENEAVRAEIESIADLWIENGADGFRMDAAMHYEENETEFNTETLEWLYNYCREKNENFYMVSEVWSDRSTIAEYYGSGAGSFFDFPLSGAEGTLAKTARGKLSASQFVSTLVNTEDAYSAENPDYVDAPFIANHDMGRDYNLLNGDTDAVKFAAGLLMTLQGSPYIYYGEEIGMQSKGTADENKRMPMYWSDSDTKGTAAAPENAESFTQSCAALDVQMKDTSSIWSYYQRAVEMRNTIPALGKGKTIPVDALCGDDTAVIRKESDGGSVYVIYNVDTEVHEVDLSALQDHGKTVYVLTLDGEAINVDGETAQMPGKSILVLNAE